MTRALRGWDTCEHEWLSDRWGRTCLTCELRAWFAMSAPHAWTLPMSNGWSLVGSGDGREYFRVAIGLFIDLATLPVGKYDGFEIGLANGKDKPRARQVSRNGKSHGRTVELAGGSDQPVLFTLGTGDISAN